MSGSGRNPAGWQLLYSVAPPGKAWKPLALGVDGNFLPLAEVTAPNTAAAFSEHGLLLKVNTFTQSSMSSTERPAEAGGRPAGQGTCGPGAAPSPPPASASAAQSATRGETAPGLSMQERLHPPAAQDFPLHRKTR